NCRSDRPSLKNSLGDCGRFLGWSAISCRKAISQPVSAIAHSAVAKKPYALIFIAHLGHVLRVNALQKSRRLLQMEIRIMRFDAQKEFIRGSSLEPLHIEERVMRLRQSIQRQHA